MGYAKKIAYIYRIDYIYGIIELESALDFMIHGLPPPLTLLYKNVFVFFGFFLEFFMSVEAYGYALIHCAKASRWTQWNTYFVLQDK